MLAENVAQRCAQESAQGGEVVPDEATLRRIAEGFATGLKTAKNGKCVC